MRIKWLDKIGSFLRRNNEDFDEVVIEIPLKLHIAPKHKSSSKNVRSDKSIDEENFRGGEVWITGWKQKGRKIGIDRPDLLGHAVWEIASDREPDLIRSPHDKETMF